MWLIARIARPAGEFGHAAAEIFVYRDVPLTPEKRPAFLVLTTVSVASVDICDLRHTLDAEFNNAIAVKTSSSEACNCPSRPACQATVGQCRVFRVSSRGHLGG